MALSVLSLNCNGIRDQSKRSGLVQRLRSLPFTVDVVCLQETHCLSLADCARHGFLPLASLLVSHLAPVIPVVVLFCIVLHCLLSSHGRTMMVGSFMFSFLFVTKT